MRLIEVNEKEFLAIKAVVYGCNTNKRLVGASFLTGIGTEKEKTISFYDALKIVDEMFDEKPVDAVPVVRCKDCKYYTIEDFDGDVCCGCKLYCAMLDIMPDGFCSYGERKDGDGDGK